MINFIRNFFSRQSIPSVCPLCLGSAYGGQVCHPCWQDLYASVQRNTQRCQYCQVSLVNSRANQHLSPEFTRPNSPRAPICQDCHEHRLALDKIYFGFDYELPIDSLILRFKNARQQGLSHALANLVYQRLVTANELDFRLLSSPPLFIPIPSSHAALKRRGYNPAAEFAKILAKKFQVPLELDVLRRQDSLSQQKSLSRQARLVASAQSYYCAYRLDYPHVILVDDIMTSGSTLDSAARALLAAGVQRVEAIVIARARHRY